MRKSLVVTGVLAAFLLVGVIHNSGEGQPPAANEEQALRQAADAYAAAFNKGDLTALGAVWAADAEYVDDAGNVTRGRDAIVGLFKKVLADAKGAKLALNATSVRLLKGDVALVDGTATLTAADGAAETGRFSSVWFKTDGRWQLRSARDLPYDGGSGPGAGGSLKALQWMVGEWEAEKGGVTVNVRWALNQAFLVQDFKVKGADGELAVVQLIGFDPLTGFIKSWTFDSRGGYGEGLWQQDGHTWTIEAAGVLPDGQVGSAVNVIRYVDDKTLVFQSRDREVGGQPIPNAEVKLVRKAAK
jgi:uncharacterized protein (TIGR02246 family)